MTIDQLLKKLPPYQGKGVYIVKGDQSTRDLIKEQKSAHKFFATDYDQVAGLFTGRTVRTVCRMLFNICKAQIPYTEEDKDLQTSRSPGAILTIAKNGGTADCKHYSAFVAGVLDSLNRNYGAEIDWVYRFASYDPKKELATHVYVVVFDQGEEIWIDAAPVRDWIGYVERDYNDRILIPEFYQDKYVNTMSIARLAGLGAPMRYASSTGGDNYGVQLVEEAVTDKEGYILDPVDDIDYYHYLQGETDVDPEYGVQQLPGLPLPETMVDVLPIEPETAILPVDHPAATAATQQDKTNNSVLIMGVIGAGLLLLLLTSKKKRK